MILDLNKLKKKNNIQTDICIIGGGTVGLYLAHELKKKKVIVIERGKDLNEQLYKSNYKFNKLNKVLKGPGYLKKKIVLGGQSTIWGGQMISLQKSDIEKREYINSKGWNIKYKDISKYFRLVDKNLKIKFLEKKFIKEFKKKSLDKNFNLRFSVFLRKKIINFYNFYKVDLESNDIKVFTNAKVNKLIDSKNQKFIEKIIAKSANSNTLEIKAKQIIICCGAIESTKLLLENYWRENITKKKYLLGKFLSEQFSCICAKFKIKDYNKFILNFSPLYKYKLVHKPRFEITSRLQKKVKSPSAYFHIQPSDKNKRKNLIDEIKNILRFYFYRIYKRKLWFRSSIEMFLLLNIEEIGNFKNQIKLILKKNKKNLGLFINYKINKRIFKIISQLNTHFNEYWKQQGYEKIADVKFFKLKKIKDLQETYHPSGTIRIGTNKNNSCCNKNLRYWERDNLFICSTAIFPTTGSANTGYTLLALASRLAKHLIKKNNF